MIKCPKFVSVALSLALFAGSGLALADPGNGKGQGNNQGGQGQGNNKANNPVGKGQGNNKGNNPVGQGYDKPAGKGASGGHGPSVDRGSVLNVLGGYRDYWSPGPALPPGIQKNLARGKPLPPGIAKKLDGRLLGRLPHYDGYEWQQAGTDLILVTIATGIIYEVLNGALD
ncbi:anti-virulence regulator CigR family protein [Pseudomonas synxantha]|uniref:anti-virulence regulator CigR family protein n=1 Tax=Pseudomonas synxantha TaxID=47883 RepID=UPI000F577BDC|nr:anti-virulence regulator CigR family protein [Pseudomonas synxantha]AZE79539.1 CigR (Putative inner membrane protein) [Pseudomonas synxantha]